MDLSAFQQKATALIEERLHALIPSQSEFLYAALFDAARYSLFSGGKRLRPLLLLASAHTFGCPLEKALDPACALECIHTYSLIHDDLPCMDNDDMRRGKPTLHRMFPEWHALLTGDYLATYAFEILAESPELTDAEKMDLIRILSKRSGGQGMIGGQMIDLLSQDRAIDAATLDQMHAHKTACLISAALECGAVIAGASTKDRALIRECGMHIGIAFQVADDILDAASEEHKKSAVSLLGPAQAHAYKEKLLHHSLSALSALSKPAPLLEKLFHKLVHRTN